MGVLTDAAEIAFPRYPGSEGDRRATEIVRHKMLDAGLEVEVEGFSYDIRPAFRAIRLVLLASAVLVLAATTLASELPIVAVSLLGAGALSGGLLLAWAPGAERLYAQAGPTKTANVTGYRRVARPRLSLILLAHHDSKSQNLTFPVRMGLTLLSLLGGTGFAGLLLAAVAIGRPVEPEWAAIVAGAATAAALAGLSFLRSGNESPGGVDNAGSVGIVLELARTLPGSTGEGVELIFLATGAEEDHMIGAMRWLAAHRERLAGRPLYALNFDGAGAPGKIVLIERYGFGKPFSRELSAVARAAASRLGIGVRGITMLPAMGIDAIPFSHRGVPCLTLSSGSLDRATISVHSANDVADHLDEATLERVVRLSREIVAELERKYAAAINSAPASGA
jgi:hypothetical protein